MRTCLHIAALGALCAMMMASNVFLDHHRPYRTMESGNGWQLLVSNISVFSADLVKLQADVIYHGGVNEAVNPAEYNMFRPYNPLVLFACQTLDHDEIKATCKTGLNVHVHVRDESETLPYMAIAAKLNPQDDDNWANCAYVLRRAQTPMQALLFLANGVERNPSNVDLRLEYAGLALRKGTTADLANASSLLLGIRPQLTNDFDARRLMAYLGSCYQLLGNTCGLARTKAEWMVEFPTNAVPTSWEKAGGGGGGD